MPQTPLFSEITIGVLSYNRPQFLREAVLSVLAQGRETVRLRVFDNASGTETMDAVRDLLEDGEWIGAETTRSAIWNMSRAIEAQDTEFFMLLHDDDRLHPGFVERQLKILRQHPEMVAVSCNGAIIDVRGVPTGDVVLPNLNDDNLLICHDSADVALIYAGASCVPMSPTIYRTRVAKAVKLREQYEKVIDAVFFCDLAERGTLGVAGSPMYDCRVHPGQDSSSFDARLLSLLDDFFWDRTSDSTEKVRTMQRKVAQYGGKRVASEFLTLLRSTRSLESAIGYVRQGWNSKYSAASAAGRILSVVAGKLVPW